MDKRILGWIFLLGLYGVAATNVTCRCGSKRRPRPSIAPTVPSTTDPDPATATTDERTLKPDELTKLFNSPVSKAEWMVRPVEKPAVAGPIAVSGVRVTLSDGSQWLIHKQPNKEVVVVSAKNMSKKWSALCSRELKGKMTVSDLMKAAGQLYTSLFNDCDFKSIKILPVE